MSFSFSVKFLNNQPNQLLRPPRSVIDLNKTYSSILHLLKQELGSLEPHENDQIVFSSGEETTTALHNTLAAFGSVSSSAFFKLTKASLLSL